MLKFTSPPNAFECPNDGSGMFESSSLCLCQKYAYIGIVRSHPNHVLISNGAISCICAPYELQR